MKAKDRNNPLIATIVCFSLTALFLTVIQAPIDMSPLAWVALIPFILACKKDAPTWRLVWSSFTIALIYWIANLYWIAYVTIPGAILMSLILAIYFPIIALGVRFARRTSIPLLIAVPILFVGAEAWQGIVCTGFNFRLLAHSQYQNLPLIQIADLFGQLGISILITAVNALIAELYISKKRFTVINIIKTALTALLLISSIIYGNHRLKQSSSTITQGPLIGSVQTNIPSAVKETPQSADAILEDLLVRSQQCFDNGAKLVAWPETIVLTEMNLDLLRYCKKDSKPVLYDQIISRHTQANKGHLIFGANAATLSPQMEITDRYNSAIHYRPDGTQNPLRFNKIHLVPFGEYIPLKNTLPFVYNIVSKLSPYEYMYNLTKGTNYTIFEMKDQQTTWRFGSIICYEDTDPKITRKLVLGKDRTKRAHWLVNLSNDGWYVKYKNEKVLPSTELAQRTAITVFRCIESRISIIRSVNTGISCMVGPTGKIHDGFLAGDLPHKAMDRQAVAGFFVDNVPIDSRTSFFSKYGYLIDIVCSVIFVAYIVIAIITRKVTNKKSPENIKGSSINCF